MRIIDAKPGDVLRDASGDIWIVCDDGAWFLTEQGRPMPVSVKAPDFGTADIAWADDEYGPFTRLVPESPEND